MSDATRSFHFEQQIPTTPQAVYRAFTNSSALRTWLCDMATTAPHVGGRCYLAWNDGYYSSGEFTELAPHEKVGFTWHGRGEPRPTQVTVTITAEDQITTVQVEHSGVGSGPGWEEMAADMHTAWPESLHNLASVLGTGADLRFTKRPMLGILVSSFDAQTAAELGVPVTEGIRLDDVLAEMSAGAAGLRGDDVIVEIGGRPVTDWTSLDNALQPHRAGDEVEVVFYRGPARHVTTMPLSGRPLPDMPATVPALADAARAQYAEAKSALDAALEGVSAGQAAFRPGENRWGVREVLAHLIHVERDWQQQIAAMAGGEEAWYDGWGSEHARVDATVAVMPTVAALSERLYALMDETVALLSHLPASFPAENRASFWRIGFQHAQPSLHIHSHVDQIRAAIAAAG